MDQPLSIEFQTYSIESKSADYDDQSVRRNSSSKSKSPTRRGSCGFAYRLREGIYPNCCCVRTHLKSHDLIPTFLTHQ